VFWVLNQQKFLVQGKLLCAMACPQDVGSFISIPTCAIKPGVKISQASNPKNNDSHL